VAASVAVVVAGSAYARADRPAAVAPCQAKVHNEVPPKWLGAGSTGAAAPRIPYVVGNRGVIAGIVFGSPLSSPPADGKHNKILWVPRHYSKSVMPLWIKMQKMEGTALIGAPVRRIIATGPGPSYVDAPSAGCWRLTLSWSGRKDTLDLVYTVPPG
jgi:hypothetical protein